MKKGVLKKRLSEFKENVKKKKFSRCDLAFDKCGDVLVGHEWVYAGCMSQKHEGKLVEQLSLYCTFCRGVLDVNNEYPSAQSLRKRLRYSVSFEESRVVFLADMKRRWDTIKQERKVKGVGK